MQINFKVSNGWHRRFGKWHGIMNERTNGEALSGVMEEIESFRQKLTKIIDNKNV
jgi:predicted component of type VI protein secretion system